MLVILDRKALVPLLVKMPHPAGMIVGMIAHRMRPADPTHEPAHFAIDKRA
jgi:hypothetical protein